MHVVEGGDQLGVLRAQQAVAEDVARHIADADTGEIGSLDVATELAKMALRTSSHAPRAAVPMALWS